MIQIAFLSLHLDPFVSRYSLVFHLLSCPVRTIKRNRLDGNIGGIGGKNVQA